MGLSLPLGPGQPLITDTSHQVHQPPAESRAATNRDQVTKAGGKRVAILQSNYIPWKGYFDLINMVDEFILFDDMQFTRRDWRNRNKIKTPNGIKWLTIPVEVKGKYFQRIMDTVVSEPDWARNHWQTLNHCYARAPHLHEFKDFLEEMYLGRPESNLSKINYAWLRAICDYLGVHTPITWSTDYPVGDVDKTHRLIEICRRAHAETYLSGPAAKDYIDSEAFRQAGITLEYMDYSNYPEYRQLHGPFDHSVSILDLLFMEGPKAPMYMKSF